MKIETDLKLDFNNVLVRPKRTTLSSRSEVDIERKFTFPHAKIEWKGVPVIASNMDTVGTFEVYNVLCKHKIITALHKHYTIEDYIEFNKQDNFNPDFFMLSTGITTENFEKLIEISKVIDFKWICIDVANGYMEKLVEYCKKVREYFPEKIIVAGNVVSREMTEELIINGKVDIVKVGIGSGCFAGDTRVLMSNGEYKNIRDINEGEYVINRDGKPVKVLAKMNKGLRDVLNIKTNNWYGKTEMTPDHKYLIYNNSNNGRFGKCRESDKVWKSIDSINQIYLGDNKYNNVNDFLLMPRKIKWKLPKDIILDFTKMYDIYDKTGKYIKIKNRDDRKMTRYIKFGYEMGYIFGAFLLNGRIEKQNIGNECYWEFNINLNVKVVSKKLMRCIEKVFKNRNLLMFFEHKMRIIDSVKDYFVELFDKFYLSGVKKLPDEYRCKNKKYILGIYNAIMDYNNYESITSKYNSKEIIELYYWCSMNLDMSYKKDIANIIYNKINNINRDENELDLYDCRKMKKKSDNGYSKKYIYTKIAYKNIGTKNEEVWDIEVDCPTHSFIANNAIVHNSACTTRLKTGIGMPQLSAIIECADASHGVNGYIIGDGGITCPADMAKAFGGGADFVMCGGVFSGHDENAGELIEENGVKYKLFYGMSSEHAMKKHYGEKAKYRTSEGRVLKVKYRGSIEDTVEDYLGGIRSNCTYINAKCIKNMPKCTTFVMVSQQLNTSLSGN